MAEFSGPWTSVALPDVQYGRLFTGHGTGVLGDPYSGPSAGLTAAADGVVVQPFQAVIRGRLYVLDAAQTFNPAPPGSSPRIDRLVVRFNPSSGVARLQWVQGTPSALPQPPALTQVPDGTWDMPKLQVRVNPTAPTLTGLFVDQPYQALPTITCTSSTRPGMNGTPTPRTGQPIYDTDLQRVLYWNGSSWITGSAPPAAAATVPKMRSQGFPWPEPNPTSARFNAASNVVDLITVRMEDPGFPYRVGCYVQAEVGTISTGTRWDLYVYAAAPGANLGDTFLLGYTVGAGAPGAEILTPQTLVHVTAALPVITGSHVNVAVQARRPYGSLDGKINIPNRSLVVHQIPA
jgi:hypothetical protein